MAECLGKYRIDGFIAEGGMARILRAKTEGIGGVEKTVALKCLKGIMSEEDSYVQMLLDEARITVNMTHKNIGQVYGLENDGNTYFMVMELIDGVSLADLCSYLFSINRVFPVEAAVFIAMEVCSGLSYAHRMLDSNGENLGIVHRDVNPQNICISKEGEVKLIDFGIAKAHRGMEETQVGTIKGKFNYMSPEQARGERVDQRTDVFALGAVLYEMLSGHMLYPQSLDDTRLRSKTRMADFVPIETYVPDIPEKLKRILAKALTRDITQRFETSRDFLLALTQFAHDACKVYDGINLSALVEKCLAHKERKEKKEKKELLVVEANAIESRLALEEHQTILHASAVSSSGKGGAASSRARTIEQDSEFSMESGDTAIINAMDARKLVMGGPEALLESENSNTNVYSKAEFDAAVKAGLVGGDSLDSPFDSITSSAINRCVDLDIKNAKAESTVMVKMDSVKPDKQNYLDTIVRKVMSLSERTLVAIALALGLVLTLGIFLFVSLGDSEEKIESTQVKQISVSATPSHAKVYIDNQPSGYILPCDIPAHEVIEIRAPLYTPKVIRLDEIQRSSLHVDLKAISGMIVIDSEPEGAKIEIDGIEMDAKTPMQKLVDITRDSIIKISKPGYLPEIMKVTWSEEDAEKPRKHLKPKLIPRESSF